MPNPTYQRESKMAKTDFEKLGILLKHWIEHNEEHGKEFQRWAEKAKAQGNVEVHDEILCAVEQMNLANECLMRAMEKLVL